MVFTRRKAEIEILCANRPCDADNEGTNPSESLLTNYLVQKICNAVESCGNKYAV